MSIKKRGIPIGLSPEGINLDFIFPVIQLSITIRCYCRFSRVMCKRVQEEANDMDISIEPIIFVESNSFNPKGKIGGFFFLTNPRETLL
jgi:hypothetical protein